MPSHGGGSHFGGGHSHFSGHSSFNGGRWGYYGPTYGGCRCNCLGIIVFLFIAAIALVVVSMTTKMGTESSVTVELQPGEMQLLTTGNAITFSSSDSMTMYVSTSKPQWAGNYSAAASYTSSYSTSANSWEYDSMYLGESTNVTFSFEFDETVTMYVVQGSKGYDRWQSDGSYMIQMTGSKGTRSLSLFSDDTYYFIVDNLSYWTALGSVTLTIRRPVYALGTPEGTHTGTWTDKPTTSTYYVLQAPASCPPTGCRCTVSTGTPGMLRFAILGIAAVALAAGVLFLVFFCYKIRRARAAAAGAIAAAKAAAAGPIYAQGVPAAPAMGQMGYATGMAGTMGYATGMAGAPGMTGAPGMPGMTTAPGMESYQSQMGNASYGLPPAVMAGAPMTTSAPGYPVMGFAAPSAPMGLESAPLMGEQAKMAL